MRDHRYHNTVTSHNRLIDHRPADPPTHRLTDPSLQEDKHSSLILAERVRSCMTSPKKARGKGVAITIDLRYQSPRRGTSDDPIAAVKVAARRHDVKAAQAAGPAYARTTGGIARNGRSSSIGTGGVRRGSKSSKTKARIARFRGPDGGLLRSRSDSGSATASATPMPTPTPTSQPQPHQQLTPADRRELDVDLAWHSDSGSGSVRHSVPGSVSGSVRRDIMDASTRDASSSGLGGDGGAGGAGDAGSYAMGSYATGSYAGSGSTSILDDHLKVGNVQMIDPSNFITIQCEVYKRPTFLPTHTPILSTFQGYGDGAGI